MIEKDHLTTKNAAYWIEKLELAAHPEGGRFKRVYCSSDTIETGCLPERFYGARPVCTAILYLLEGSDFSALHRLKSDEIWHFYTGSPVLLTSIDPDGILSEHLLGDDPDRGEQFQVVMEKNHWFGARVVDPDSFALVGCTVAPGFDFEDFELGDRDTLLRLFPQHCAAIEKLTRASGEQAKPGL